ncbi:MAG: ATP-binding cassette domain-containing protein [Bacteroidetes bacterium]|nr:MAG: ATP-binding cassette domain-containing protein [Bacteroidota bacterium]
MIELKNINYTFQKGTVNETKALSEINLTIKSGEFVVLIGSNGSGKSTLMNSLADTVIPDSGKILVDGIDATNLPEHKRCKWIARLFQNPLLGTAPDLSVLENFRLAALRTQKKGLQIGTGKKFRDEVADHVGALGLDLEKKLDQPVGTLSGGQRQAMTLSMAVMDEAKILLMDEPTAALDPKTSEVFMKLAKRVIAERRLTCILITHQLKDALNYGNRLILLREGKIIHDIQGDKKEKLTQNELFVWFGE